MYNKILLIGDMVSACKVALSAMVPVLSYKKHSVYCLPTEIVSNTFGYKKVAQVSTGDYVQKTIDAWQQLDFDFDAVFVGYITDKQQADAVISYCKELKNKGVKIFHDAIMGENGHLYYGIGEEVADIHKEILPLTDYTFPSYTEAAYLTGKDYTLTDVSLEEIYEVIDGLLAMGAKNIALTSCKADGSDCIVGYDKEREEKFVIYYDRLPVKIGGTGDVFSACAIGDILNGFDFKSAVQNSVTTVYSLILMEKDKEDKLRGLNLEKLLPAID